jgi:predicted phosphoribosyltransferase
MTAKADSNVFDLPALRGRTRVFADRADAGEVLATMLDAFRRGGATVLAVPAGGVPVGAVLADRLGLPLDVAVVSKITPPWNSEIGYGAVAFDGSVRLNDQALARMGLTQQQIAEGIARTAEKVNRRARDLRAGRGPLDLAQKAVILTDDGLASGFTMAAAAEAVAKGGAAKIILAVPTAHRSAAARLGGIVHAVHCPNIRSGWSFAVADAYRNWSDVNEAEAARLLRAK